MCHQQNEYNISYCWNCYPTSVPSWMYICTCFSVLIMYFYFCWMSLNCVSSHVIRLLDLSETYITLFVMCFLKLNLTQSFYCVLSLRGFNIKSACSLPPVESGYIAEEYEVTPCELVGKYYMLLLWAVFFVSFRSHLSFM